MKFLFYIFACIYSISSFAQRDSVQNVFSIKALSGQVYVHTNTVRNVKGVKPYGIEVEFAKQQTNFNSWNLAAAYVKTGWTLAYINFNSGILGKGIIASRFIEPQYRLTSNLQFLLRASIGLDYLSNPNNAIKNPTNNNYSLHINPYMQIGAGLQYQLSKHSAIGLVGNFHHISNGNLMQPNKGINWLTGALSFAYYPNNIFLPKYSRVYNNFWNNKKPSINIGLFVVPQQGYYAKYAAQRNFIVGVTAQATKQISSINALTIGTEIYYDDFMVDKTQPPIKSKIVAGIQGGHVFLLGKINFSQQIGYNLHNKIYFLPDFYTRLGLDYKLSNHYAIGVNLKANSDNADFFDVRLTYKL